MYRSNILNIFENCDFSGILSSDNFYEKILELISLKEDEYDYEYGASKLCIIPKNLNYVIKIPFSYDYCGDVVFANANKDKNRYWDYCFSEILLYKEAKKHRIEEVFIKTKCTGLIKDYPIYIQEKVIPHSKIYLNGLLNDPLVDRDKTQATLDYCKKKNIQCFNEIWATNALEYYGCNKFERIMKFIEKTHIIDDLHRNNIGYFKNKPVIFDYAGFND